MDQLSYLRRRPPLAALIAAVVVGIVQAAGTVVITKTSGPQSILGARPMLNPLVPAPGGARVGLLVACVVAWALLIFAAWLDWVGQIAIGLAVGGMLANGAQLAVAGWVLDWISLPPLAIVSPGDIAIGVGVAIFVIRYSWEPQRLPLMFDRRELLGLAAVITIFSIVAGAQHHFTEAVGGVATVLLAWITALIANWSRGRRRQASGVTAADNAQA